MVTWKWVFDSKLPALVAMAKRAGIAGADSWHLTSNDVPILVTANGAQHCDWSTARECANYLQAWIDALSVVVLVRESPPGKRGRAGLPRVPYDGELRPDTPYRVVFETGPDPYVVLHSAEVARGATLESARQAAWKHAATCTRCGCTVGRLDDGTLFVTDTGTTADGLTFCPPDPDSEPVGDHVLPY